MKMTNLQIAADFFPREPPSKQRLAAEYLTAVQAVPPEACGDTAVHRAAARRHMTKVLCAIATRLGTEDELERAAKAVRFTKLGAFTWQPMRILLALE